MWHVYHTFPCLFIATSRQTVFPNACKGQLMCQYFPYFTKKRKHVYFFNIFIFARLWWKLNLHFLSRLPGTKQYWCHWWNTDLTSCTIWQSDILPRTATDPYLKSSWFWFDNIHIYLLKIYKLLRLYWCNRTTFHFNRRMFRFKLKVCLNNIVKQYRNENNKT
jgi:hypothetical protein